ncbi:MAG: LPPG:FO 2-phospho-L-lactate transferase like, CofD-like [Parcubacteria bacterium C7867-004]|nr:MAG: LPPG:FO 2-phospho-L-lactate transferase like, CofD-like [Parcubacteria bacterium C7867-004]
MKNIVTIGGGTGTFVVLSGLRRIPGVALSAIVTSADDGGSTGHLRDAYGFLPAGDARQALVALAEDGNVLRDLFAYRFEKSDVKGHNLGNLFLTALTDLLGSDAAALEEASRILRVCGTVIPATEEATTLVAKLADGSVLKNERLIDDHAQGRARIEELALEKNAALSPAAKDAIEEADLIVLGPGDLYTSSIAALLPDGMKEAVQASRARLVYVGNLFTKAGQTEGYTARDHVREIARYAGREPDVIILNDNGLSKEVLEKYAAEGEYPPVDDFLPTDARVRRLPLVSVYVVPAVENDPLPRSLIRHDPAKLAAALSKLL